MKYAILNTQDYNTLNASISEALGYPDNSGTERYAPIAEGDNVQAMPIIAEIQERFPELIANYELVDNIPTYESDNEQADLESTEQMGYVAE